MSLEVLTTDEVIKQFGNNEKDTGNTKVQIVLLTKKINHLSGHLGKNKKDHHNTLSLLKMVGKRRRLLKYLQNINLEGYRTLIKELGLRH